MPNYYIDPVDGNDSTGDGSLENPWQTITSGATVDRITAGDEIRIKKNDDPISIGTVRWTNTPRIKSYGYSYRYGYAFSLSSARTLTICDCDNAWTQSADVTQSNNSAGIGSRTIKGDNQTFAIASGFTTGKVAYYNLGSSIDCSDYQKISFAFYVSGVVNANVFSIRLCSDTSGDTAVDTFMVPYRLNNGSAHVLIDNGSALGSNIQSVAIYAESDPGTITISIDQILATNDLAPGCLLGKNDDEWFRVICVDDTEVVVGTVTYEVFWTIMDTDLGYYTTYILSDFTVFNMTGSDTSESFNTINDSGTMNNPIKYRGGWNFDTDSQDGYTNFGAWQISTGSFFYGNNKSYIRIERFRIRDPRYSAYQDNTSTFWEYYDICSVDFYFYAIYNESNSSTYKMEGIIYSQGGYAYSESPLSLDTPITHSLTITADIISRCSCFGLMSIGGTGDCIITGNVEERAPYSTSSLIIDEINYLYIKSLNLLSTNCFERIRANYVVVDSIVMIAIGDQASSLHSINTSSCGTVRICEFRSNNFSLADLLSNYPLNGTLVTLPSSEISIEKILDDGESFFSMTKGGSIIDSVTAEQSLDWTYDGENRSTCLLPVSSSFPLLFQTYLPVEADVTYKVTFQKKRTAATFNGLFYLNVYGCGITSIVDESITLTDSWEQHSSADFTTTISGFVRIVLKLYKGTTSDYVAIDDLCVEEQ